MKKTYKYIVTVAVVLMGLLQFTSCNDANDWSVDSSVIKQRPPTDLKVEVKDSATLDLTVQIGTVESAESYELQASTSVLTSNGDLPVEGDIYTFSGITTDDFEKGKYIIKRSKEDNGQFTVEQNTKYYFRVRAIGKDGSKSNWYTNGQLYYGGVSDESLAEKLIENTTKNISTNSDGKPVGPVVETPATMWIRNLDVESDALTVNWHETDYVTAKYLRLETSGLDDVDISNVPTNPKYTKTKVWSYKWSGLEVDKEYTFSLLDADKNVISTVSRKTEYDPNLSISYFIGNFPVIAQKDADIVLKGKDADGNETELFQGLLKNGEKMKTEEKKSSDNAFISPFVKGDVFQPLSPGYKTTADANKYNRISTGGSSSSIELTIPARGRLYIYMASNKNNSGVLTITQYGDEDVVLEETKLDIPYQIINLKSGGTEFLKAYVETEINGKKVVKTTLTWNQSEFLCGIHFAPWEAIPNKE